MYKTMEFQSFRVLAAGNLHQKPSCRHGLVVKDKEDSLSRVQERVLMAELAASHHRRREGKLKTAMVAQSSCDLQSVCNSMYCFLSGIRKP